MKKCVFYLVPHCQTQMKGSWATWRGSDSSQLASGYLLRWIFSFPQFSPLEAFLSSVALKSSLGNHCNVHWCDLLHILYHIFVIKRSLCSFFEPVTRWTRRFKYTLQSLLPALNRSLSQWNAVFCCSFNLFPYETKGKVIKIGILVAG